MASISSLVAPYVNRPSPRDLLQQQLSDEVSAGKVKAADKAALSSAIDSIDSSIRSQQTAGPPPALPPDRGRGKSLKEAVSNLIQQQVDSGALTSDQATELKQVFADTFSKGRPEGKASEGGPESSGGPEGTKEAGGRKGQRGGPRGVGGPPPPPPPPQNESTSSTASSSSSDTLGELLKKLQKAVDSAQTYSAGGTGKSATTTKALLIDFSV